VNSLKTSSINAAKWNFFANIGSYFISFFLSIILARILEPKEFGMTGMLAVFIAIAVVFINSGISVAIVRSKDITEDDYSTAFYFNVVVGLFFYSLFFILSPLIADFFNEPILVPLTKLLSLVFVINSFGIIQNTILIKEINLKKQSICYLLGMLVSAIVSAIMAFNNYGVYSIVGQSISQALTTNILFWLTSKWKPSGRFKFNSFRKIWSFGSKVLATNLVSTFVDNIDNFLIGKIFYANQLGYYVRAKSSKIMPEQILTNTLQATIFPILSKVNDNDNLFLQYHLKFYNLAVYIFLPVVFGFIAVAKAFTIVLYTEKWLPSVPFLQIIILSSISIFLSAFFNQTIMAKGEGNLYMKLNTIKKLIGLFSIPFGVFWGLIPFLWAFVFISVVSLSIDYYFVSKLLKISMKYYFIKLFKPLVLSIAMFLCAYAILFLPIANYYVVFLTQIFTGVFVYIFLSSIFRIEEFLYLKEIVFGKSHHFF